MDDTQELSDFLAKVERERNGLRARIAELEAKNKWTRVVDGLPRVGCLVIVRRPWNPIEIDSRNSCGWDSGKKDIIAWHPLPKSLKENP